jgi:hypothetical protein
MIYSLRHRAFSMRFAALFLVGGLFTMLTASSLHPASIPPDNSPLVFMEYAADASWLDTHLGQFIGVLALLLGLIGMLRSLSTDGPAAAAFSSLGSAAAIATLALMAALQAVDGPALKFVVDRYAASPAEMSETALRIAEATRWIEVGLNSYFRTMLGVSLALAGLALAVSRNMPRWLGWIALLGGLGSVYQGYYVAHNGFALSANLFAILPTYLTFAWMLIAGATLWLLARKLDAVQPADGAGALELAA